MFVDRTDRQVTGTFVSQQYDGQEEIADDSPEVAEFYERIMPRRVEMTPAQKLAFVGLSVDELKQLLGIGQE